MGKRKGRKVMKTVVFPDGAVVPAIGQGTWYLGEDPRREEEEICALRTGIEAGMTLIDTAEMYGSGRSEILVGKAIKGYDRKKLFLVSKVLPSNAGEDHIFQSCEASLARLGTDYLDLYLLHWQGEVPFEETILCMEELMRRGWIRRWGVSNMDREDMEEIWRTPGGADCAADQVLYHMASRGIEYDLLPALRACHTPVMAYCPLAQQGTLAGGLWKDPVLASVAAAHHASPAEILLAFVIRGGDVIAIPRSGNAAHVRENGAAAEIVLSVEEFRLLDKHFPAPAEKTPLDIV